MTTAALPPIVVRNASGTTEHVDVGYCRTYLGAGIYKADLFASGPTIHTAYCSKDPRDTATSGSGCITPDQDGAAIKAERDARAEARRFTPPEFRDPLGKPPKCRARPVLDTGRIEQREVVALRGRPRTADGTAEWATWETYTETSPGHDGSFLTEFIHQVPKRLSPEDAAAVVAEFESRLPHYEFKIVHARLVIEEEQLA